MLAIVETVKEIENIEKHLLKRLADDDEKSFEYIFNFYYKQLKSYATSFLLDPVLSQDIIQEVFFKVWDNRKSLEIKGSLRAYLYRMVHNQCLDYIRQIKYDFHSIDTIDLHKRSDIIGFKENDPILERIFSDEMLIAFESAVEKLPAQCKKIFLKNRIENLSYKEIAEELNISVSTVKNQMMIAMNKLSSELKSMIISVLIIILHFF